MGEVRKYNNMKTNILFTLLTLFLIMQFLLDSI